MSKRHQHRFAYCGHNFDQIILACKCGVTKLVVRRYDPNMYEKVILGVILKARLIETLADSVQGNA